LASHDVPIGATQVSLAQLNERSREIFRQIVESYLATGEPVGSRNISRLITTPLSPASVLNEASGMLSGLTHSAGVVLTAKSNVRIKHIEFVRLEPERALVVLVAEDGQVENRILPVPAGLLTSALTEASNFLNAYGRGRTLAEAKAELEKAIEAGKAALDQLTQKVVEAGLASWSGGESGDRRLIVRGHANLLDDLRALDDLERVRLLFDELETKRGVIDMLGRAERAEGARIFIGSENKLFSLSGSSTIVAPYRDGAGRIIGVIGVIGPTRLNYARVIPLVDYTAKVVSKLVGG
jgi:heat-inducible transcriptional repressor